MRRKQLNLTFINTDTADYVDMLAERKQLKNVLTTFLDKLAADPESTMDWLQDDSAEGVVESEDLIELKTSLALFTTFVQNAREQANHDVDSFTDFLTDDEYIRFRTNFEKSQLLIESAEPEYEQEMGDKTNKIETLEKAMLELTDQVKDIQTQVSKIANGQATTTDEIETSVTTNHTPVLVRQEENLEEKVEKESKQEVRQEPVYEDEIEDKPKPEADNEVEVEDVSEAMDIFDSLIL